MKSYLKKKEPSAHIIGNVIIFETLLPSADALHISEQLHPHAQYIIMHNNSNIIFFKKDPTAGQNLKELCEALCEYYIKENIEFESIDCSPEYGNLKGIPQIQINNNVLVVQILEQLVRILK